MNPLWYETAEKYIGTREIPGRNTNPHIQRWLDLIRAPFTGDEIPWCGSFVGGIMIESGLESMKKPYWALNWASYGQPMRKPQVGAIAVFRRRGGGHVGFYAGRSKGYPVILGGNQGDRVSKATITLQLVAYRWPPGEKMLVGVPVPTVDAGTETKVT